MVVALLKAAPIRYEALSADGLPCLEVDREEGGLTDDGAVKRLVHRQVRAVDLFVFPPVRAGVFF